MSPVSIWCSVKAFPSCPLPSVDGAPCDRGGHGRPCGPVHSGHPAVACPTKASCAQQAPHALLLAPQPRRRVWTPTSPATTATASPSGGSVTARRSVPTAPMSSRPLAVSPVPRAGGGGVLGFGFLVRSSLLGGWEAQVRWSVQHSPGLTRRCARRGSWQTAGESSSWCPASCFGLSSQLPGTPGPAPAVPGASKRAPLSLLPRSCHSTSSRPPPPTRLPHYFFEDF